MSCVTWRLVCTLCCADIQHTSDIRLTSLISSVFRQGQDKGSPGKTKEVVHSLDIFRATFKTEDVL